MKAEIITTSPRSTIYSYKSLGYSFSTAIADIIDNSIAADALNINIITPDESEQTVYIVDDGNGMDMPGLLTAMNPGGKDPTIERSAKDLGRFGLGLKTASFSQCNLLKVITKKDNGQYFSRTWDIDFVLENDVWQLFEEDITKFESELINDHGTIVKWSRFKKSKDQSENHEFHRNINEASDYCRLVFHRYLQKNKINIKFNSTSIEPFDPFFVNNEKVLKKPTELHSFGSIQALILDIPNGNIHKKEKENYDLINGFTQSQGVYIYRNDRIISYGGWFNLFKNNELARLARVEVNYNNKLDEDWSLDVVKSKAIPPKGSLKIFQRIFEDAINESKQVFKDWGRRITKSKPFKRKKISHIWNSSKDRDAEKYSYKINRKNKFITQFAEENSIEMKTLNELFKVVEEFIPLENIIENNSQNPSGHIRDEIEASDSIIQMAIFTKQNLIKDGQSETEIQEFFQNTVPYSHFPEIISAI